jgi:uncharacterized OsmC-like protein
MLNLNSYLERKSGVLAQRRQDFAAEPAKATVTLRADSWVVGFTGARPVKMGAHTLLSDSAAGLGGNALGPSAPELLAGALASCLAHTYLIAATFHAIPLEGVTVQVQGQLDLTGVVGLPSPDLPCIQNVTWQAQVETSAGAEAVALLHAEVDRMCPVLNTLRLPVSVTRTEQAPD